MKFVRRKERRVGDVVRHRPTKGKGREAPRMKGEREKVLRIRHEAILSGEDMGGRYGPRGIRFYVLARRYAIKSIAN